MRPSVIAAVPLALLITLLHFSNALPIVDGSRKSNAASKVIKRATNCNPDSDQAGRLIPGDVHIWTRTADDLSNAGSLITAPARALHLTVGDVYAPSIMVNESGGALYLELGQNCKISADSSTTGHCPMNIDVNEPCDTELALYFNIVIDDRFIDGQANMTVTFVHVKKMKNDTISGYLYFDSQPNDGCDPSTQPPHTSDIPVQCNCPTTGCSDQTTHTHCLEQAAKVVSGSRLDHVMALPVLLAASVLCSVT